MKQIKRLDGRLIFEYDENAETLVEFINRTKWKDFFNANLNGVDLSGANLRCANLRGADLRGANLSDADLYCADLRGANLSGADLYCADLSGADLSGVDLRCANLRCADLRGANLSGADLYCADLRGANLYCADLIVYHDRQWTAYIQPDHIRIGCKYYAVAEWRNFTDRQISEMAENALEYWKANREVILMIADRLKKERDGRNSK